MPVTVSMPPHCHGTEYRSAMAVGIGSLDADRGYAGMVVFECFSCSPACVFMFTPKFPRQNGVQTVLYTDVLLLCPKRSHGPKAVGVAHLPFPDGSPRAEVIMTDTEVCLIRRGCCSNLDRWLCFPLTAADRPLLRASRADLRVGVCDCFAPPAAPLPRARSWRQTCFA
jgi:hypothetical protein